MAPTALPHREATSLRQVTLDFSEAGPAVGGQTRRLFPRPQFGGEVTKPKRFNCTAPSSPRMRRGCSGEKSLRTFQRLGKMPFAAKYQSECVAGDCLRALRRLRSPKSGDAPAPHLGFIAGGSGCPRMSLVSQAGSQAIVAHPAGHAHAGCVAEGIDALLYCFSPGR